ncbi:Rne/Rng family ribonuclease [Acetobacteraceae bacterium]|nr:Rne/Rng family ribonuclease [Acetobacteraceae bacterium]
MLIDATHPEETRVAVINGDRLEEYDVEIASRKPLKGNIYVARIIRIEPSLQAAFVDYGGNRHGFLPLNEIHPDYFRIPVADRQKLQELQEQENAYLLAQEEEEFKEDSSLCAEVETPSIEQEESASNAEKDDDFEVSAREEINSPRGELTKFLRSYRIQEVLRPRQVVLVQVTKEERGNKGAALSTFLSLPGRYSVLMPNTLHGGGISRKISSREDRKRLRNLIQQFELPSCMGMIIRTAGSGQPDAEIRRDCDYLRQLWEKLRLLALESEAPVQIHEEGNLIKRALRDLLTPDIEEIIIDGRDAFRTARNYATSLLSKNAPELRIWNGRKDSLFSHFHVDDHIHSMVSPTVQLESGGYVVINQTEALVAIDVNSGKSTSQRNIEETAIRTNLEAAEEIARQLRLRDLAGLIVIDFIDMTKNRHNAQVERKLRDALKADRARLQVGSISGFGLLEMSRQRLRPSLSETLSIPCPHCEGTGRLRSIESLTLRALRVLDREAAAKVGKDLIITLPTDVALYLLNHKRDTLKQIERRHNIKITCAANSDLTENALQIEGQDISEAIAPPKAEETNPPKRNDRNGRTQKSRSRHDRNDRSDRHERQERQDRHSHHNERDFPKEDEPAIAEEKNISPQTPVNPSAETRGSEEETSKKPQRKTRAKSVSSQRKRRQKPSEQTAQEPDEKSSEVTIEATAKPEVPEMDEGKASADMEMPKVENTEAKPTRRRRTSRRSATSKKASVTEEKSDNIQASEAPASKSDIENIPAEKTSAPLPAATVKKAPKEKAPENLNAPKAVDIDSVTEKKEWKNPWQTAK